MLQHLHRPYLLLLEPETDRGVFPLLSVKSVSGFLSFSFMAHLLSSDGDTLFRKDREHGTSVRDGLHSVLNYIVSVRRDSRQLDSKQVDGSYETVIHLGINDLTC